MPTVWVPKDAGHDLSAAKEYGEVRMILAAEDSPFNLHVARPRIQEQLQACAKEGDFVIPCGPAAICMVFAVEWAKLFDSMKVLMFHAGTQKYMVREITIRS